MIQDTFDFAADAQAHALGEEVLYTNVSGSVIAAPMRAIFGSAFTAVQSGDVRLSSRRPEITVRLADVPNPLGAAPPPRPAEGDEVQVRDRPFVVTTVRPDVEDVSVVLVLKATD